MINLQSLVLRLSYLGKFWQEKVNRQIFRWNVLFVVLQLIILIAKFNDLPKLVPLFYSLPWGASQLVSASFLFVIPLISILITVTNSILAVYFLSSINFFSRLLLIFSALFTLFGLVTLYQIISLVS